MKIRFKGLREPKCTNEMLKLETKNINLIRGLDGNYHPCDEPSRKVLSEFYQRRFRKELPFSLWPEDIVRMLGAAHRESYSVRITIL